MNFRKFNFSCLNSSNFIDFCNVFRFYFSNFFLKIEIFRFKCSYKLLKLYVFCINSRNLFICLLFGGMYDHISIYPVVDGTENVKVDSDGFASA